MLAHKNVSVAHPWGSKKADPTGMKDAVSGWLNPVVRGAGVFSGRAVCLSVCIALVFLFVWFGFWVFFPYVSIF